MDSSKRPYAAACIVDLAGLLIFFGYAAYTVSANTVIPSLSLRWELYSALLLFFRWLPLLNFLTFCFAFGTKPADGTEGSRAMLPAALLSIVYACLVLILEPGIDLRKNTIEQSSLRFNSSVALCRDSLKDGHTQLARKALMAAKAIDPDDERVIGLESEVGGAEIRAASSAELTAPAQTEPLPETRAAGSGSEFLQKAQSYYAERDYFSAYWYANEAQRISPKLAGAKELAAAAWNELNIPSGDPEARARGEFYQRKFEAYGRLRAADYPEAYRLFNALGKEKPDDSDVKRYLAESRSGLQSIAFFRDEAARALAAKAYPRFFIVLHPEAKLASKGARDRPDNAASGHIVVIAAAEAGFTPSAAFFSDIEYLDSAGPRIQADMAKLSGGRLLFTAVDRTNPEPGLQPHYVQLPLSSEDVALVSVSRASPSSLDLAQLFSSIQKLPLFGLDTSALVLELLRRLGEPFGLLAASILGLLLGRRFCPRGAKLPKGSWLAIIMISAVSGLIYVAADRVDSLISRCIAGHLSGLPALIGVSAGVRLFFLLIIVLLAASLGSSQDRVSSEPEEF